MVGAVVYHDDGVLPPVALSIVQVLTQFDQKKDESNAIVFTTVDCEHQVAITAAIMLRDLSRCIVVTMLFWPGRHQPLSLSSVLFSTLSSTLMIVFP